MPITRLRKSLFVTGGFLLGLTAAGVVLRVSGRGNEPWPLLIGSLVFLIVVGVGLAMSLIGLAAVLGRSMTSEIFPPRRLHDDTSDLRELILELKDEFNLLRTNIATELARREVAEDQTDEPSSEPAQTLPGEPAASPRILAILEEIRDLSLMNESQRQEHLKRRRNQKKLDRLSRAQQQIRIGHWAEAQKLIDTVSHDFPDDSDLKQVRDELRLARADAQQEAVKRARTRVEDLLALSQWDQAIELTGTLSADYPDSTEATKLHQRVSTERELYRENTAERLYQSIKKHVEHRQWQKAKSEADRLLAEFADHRRAAKIREQVAVIHENADVQQRQQQEAQIQDLIKAQHYAEAIELAEDLIARFPQSLQARGLEEMLPRLRQRAINEEFGHDSSD